MEARPLRFPLWAKIATAAIVITLFIVLLRTMGGLLSPFLWAMVTAYLLSPVVRGLSVRTRTGRFWWVLLLYIVAGFLVYTGVTKLVPRLVQQISDLQAAAPQFAESLTNMIEQSGTFSIGSFNLDLRPAEADFTQWFTDVASNLPQIVPKLVLGVIEQLILGLVFLVVTFYLLLQGDRLVEGIYDLVPAPYRAEIKALGGSIDRVLGAYIRSQIILIVVMSVLTWATLSVLQVQYALVLGIATGFLEVIPFVGPYTAAGIAVFVSLVQNTTPFGWPQWALALAVALAYLILRQAEDHLIIPNLVGHLVELHPIIVIFAILAGGHLGGALGLLVAIPMAATIRIILVYLYNKMVDGGPAISDVRAEEAELLDSAAEERRAPQARGGASIYVADPHRGDLADEPAAR